MPEAHAPAAPLHLALVGNANVGKTSLFNALTGLRQKVGNYPGVTVDRREGRCVLPGGRELMVLDLPGVPSLVPRSPDERIAVDVLLGRVPHEPRPDAVAVVIDASQVRRGLFLLSQVLECGLPTLVCLNMVDEARKSGLEIDGPGLESRLGGIPVVETVGVTGTGVELLGARLADAKAVNDPAALPRYAGIAGLPAPSVARWDTLREVVREGAMEDAETEGRWRWVEDLVGHLRLAPPPGARRRSDRLDRWLLHPILGPVFFLLVMGTVFQAVFSLAEAPMALIEGGVGRLGGLVGETIGTGLVARLLVDGVIGGVGAVLVFLPQILILFLFLGILEDSGYLTRAAFLVDRPLRALGLSGRSFIPLLSSFACAIPGILAARTIEDWRERALAIFIAPLMTCSARLPVYTILIGAFVEERTVLGFLGLQGLVLLALYVAGMVIAAVVAMIMNRILSRSGSSPCIVELPPFRRPRLRGLAIRLWQRASLFLRRAGTVILAMSVVVWALTTFPMAEPRPDETAPRAAARQLRESAAGRLGRALEPVIEPLGYDWRIGIGLVTSFAAREVFVSTMGVVYAVEDSEDEGSVGSAMRAARWDGTAAPVYTLPTVLSLLVFYVIALQCMSTVAVVRREMGSWAWAIGQLALYAAIAWGFAFLTFRIAGAAGL